MDFKALRKHLETAAATVRFRKANGELRTLECTLADYLLPETTQRSNHPEGETMIVYDLEADGWRSFRLESVIDYELL